jgi:hypothetical protein
MNARLMQQRRIDAWLALDAAVALIAGVGSSADASGAAVGAVGRSHRPPPSKAA